MKALFIACLTFLSIATQAQCTLTKGDPAPDFVGVDQFSKSVDSKEILDSSDIVLVFYRGTWCPYCMDHLREIQLQLNNLEKYAKVIVVTPEQPPAIKQTLFKTGAKFSIVSDPTNAIAKLFNVEMPSQGRGFRSSNDVKASAAVSVLPIPATFILGREGKIQFTHCDPDYHMRSNISQLVAILKKMNKK